MQAIHLLYGKASDMHRPGLSAGLAFLPWPTVARTMEPSGTVAFKALRASFRAISAARLNASLRFHLRPIDVVVYHGPWRRPHLGESFALRCFQRLSRPDAATRRCGWRHNRCTVGPSDPVLSY